jgi:F-type H+-transporting ATPase subunit b
MRRLRQVSLHLCAYALACAPQAFAEEAAHGPIVTEHGVVDAHGNPIEAAHGAADAAAHGGGSEAGLPQFDPSSFPSQIFWLAVAFGILYIFFSKKSLPDISSVLENRRQHIQSDLDTAEQLRKQAEDVHRAYEEALDKARVASTDFYVEAEKKIKEKTLKEMDAFYQRAGDHIAATEKRIDAAKAGAMEDMSSIAAAIAAEVAEKVVGISTDLKDAKSVVQSIHKRKAA